MMKLFVDADRGHWSPTRDRRGDVRRKGHHRLVLLSLPLAAVVLSVCVRQAQSQATPTPRSTESADLLATTATTAATTTATTTAATTTTATTTTPTTTATTIWQVLPGGCVDPVAPDNGTYQPATGPYLIGDVIKFRCNAGHLLVGTGGTVCSEVGAVTDGNGAPTPQPPALTPTPIVGVPTNTTSSGVTVGVLKPASVVMGTWTGYTPRCIDPSCGDPGSPKYGYRMATGTGGRFVYSSLVMFGCHPGYRLNGHSVTRCVNDGKRTVWAQPVPQCLPLQCSGPYNPQNSRLVLNNRLSGPYNFGDTVDVQCTPGYGFVGPYFGQDVAPMKCGLQGKWNQQPVSCLRVQCPDVRTLPHGYSRTNQLYPSASSVISYGCISEYELRGSVSRVCRQNATWSGEPASCDQMVCSGLQAPPNGRWSKSEAFVGESVELICENGHRRSGSGRMRCGSDKRWYGVPSECLDGFRYYPVLSTVPAFLTTPLPSNLTSSSPTPSLDMSKKRNTVVFGFPMRIVIAVGCGIIGVLAAIVGTMWVRRWRRRRRMNPNKNCNSSPSASIQYNPAAFEFDKTMMSLASRAEADGSHTPPPIEPPYKTSTLNTTSTSVAPTYRTSTPNTTSSHQSTGSSTDLPTPPPPPPPPPPPLCHLTGSPTLSITNSENFEALYDELASSRRSSDAAKSRHLLGRLAFAPMTDDEKETILATPHELEYDVPVLESCSEVEHNIYDDTIMMSPSSPNLYSEAHCHVHVYDKTENDNPFCAVVGEGAYPGDNRHDTDAYHDYNDLNDNKYDQAHGLEGYYMDPPDLDEIYTDLAEDIAHLNLCATVDEHGEFKLNHDVAPTTETAAVTVQAEEYNRPVDFLPPLDGLPSALITRRKSSKRPPHRNSRAKSMVSESFRRILQNKRRRISVGSSFDAELRPTGSYAKSTESERQLPPAPPANDPDDKYNIPFGVTTGTQHKQQGGPGSDYHQPIDRVDKADEGNQHYYRQPVDSLSRDLSARQCLRQYSAVSTGLPPPPPPCDLPPLDSCNKTQSSTSGLEYLCSTIVGPHKPPRAPKKNIQIKLRNSITRTSVERPMSLPIEPQIIASKTERRKSKPAVPKKPRAPGQMFKPVAKPPTVVAESGDIYRLPEKLQV